MTGALEFSTVTVPHKVVICNNSRYILPFLHFMLILNRETVSCNQRKEARVIKSIKPVIVIPEYNDLKNILALKGVNLKV